MMNPPWRSSLFGRQEQTFSAPGFVQSINAMGHWQAFDCAAASALILQPLNVRSLSDIHVLRDTSASMHVARHLHILCGTFGLPFQPVD
jgi:hypothetical protein